MTSMHSGGSSPIRMAVGFALGLVVILSAVAVIIMDRKVSGLEEHTGAIVERLDTIERRLDVIERRQDAFERRLQVNAQGDNP